MVRLDLSLLLGHAYKPKPCQRVVRSPADLVGSSHKSGEPLTGGSTQRRCAKRVLKENHLQEFTALMFGRFTNVLSSVCEKCRV